MYGSIVPGQGPDKMNPESVFILIFMIWWSTLKKPSTKTHMVWKNSAWCSTAAVCKNRSCFKSNFKWYIWILQKAFFAHNWLHFLSIYCPHCIQSSLKFNRVHKHQILYLAQKTIIALKCLHPDKDIKKKEQIHQIKMNNVKAKKCSISAAISVCFVTFAPEVRKGTRIIEARD